MLKAPEDQRKPISGSVKLINQDDKMSQREQEISEQLFHSKCESLGEQERNVARHLATRTHIARNTSQEFADQLTLGQRLADRVAAFGGSWTFIAMFGAMLFLWIVLNWFLLLKLNSTFDPYPYILLNLVLSMLAAIQAPVILMSQNRQAYRDRLDAEHDYEVNLKSELEIMTLHEKIDGLREQLISIQQEQLKLPGQLIDGLKNRQ